MKRRDERTPAERWALIRFAIISPLLAAPPRRGDLRSELECLSKRTWEHPITGEPVRFAVSTLERWLYKAQGASQNPVGALRRKTRKDAGEHPSLGEALRQALEKRYRENMDWDARLHYDNLVEQARRDPTLGRVPSYSTVQRYMRAAGMVRRKLASGAKTEGGKAALRRLEQREVCGYEHDFVGALFHWDCHIGSRPVLTRGGGLVTPVLFGMLDDCSRLCCHLQWYLSKEDTESLVHGLCQGFLKYGLPWLGMSDQGAAMRAEEMAAGLEKLGVKHQMTLPYSPYQNGKQEAFWDAVESRLMPMLRGVRHLELGMLNEATQAWVTYEYNRREHRELGESPLSRFLRGPSVLRPCPDADALRRMFRRRRTRKVRRSDGTVSLLGQRFEVPTHLRHAERLHLRFAEWDRTRVDVEDPRTGVLVARLFPQDKARNADGRRRRIAKVPGVPAMEPRERPDEVAPLLARYMQEARESGLPPPYIPISDDDEDNANDESEQD